MPASLLTRRKAAPDGARRARALGGGTASAYLFLAPWLLGFTALTLGPMLASLYLSFTDFNLLEPPRWAGLDNYVRMATADPRYWTAVRVTLFYVALSVPAKLAAALALALALDKGIRGLSLYRAVFYLPSLFGASVAIAVMWRQLFGVDGLFNHVLGWFGAAGPSWVSDPDTAIYTLVALSVWQFGSPMIIFLAGLRQIPTEVYDAAAIDGAGAVRKFLHVTLPLLGPIIFFNLVLQSIEAFKAFTQAFIVSGGTGGPIDSTLFYTLYLYDEAFNHFRMGYASAMAWVLLAAIAVFTACAFASQRLWVFYENDAS